MDKIYIAVDSGSDLSPETAYASNVEVLPHLFSHKGRTFREFYDIDPARFLELLDTDEEAPVFSHLTQAAFSESFARAAETGCTHYLSILLGSEYGTTYETAKAARDTYYETSGRGLVIELIDSHTCSMCYGLAALNAAKQRDAGVSFAEICASVHRFLSKSEIIFTVYDFSYLKNSGFIQGTDGFIGDVLGLLPVIRLCRNAAEVIGKAGSGRAIIDKLSETLREYADLSDCRSPMLVRGKIPDEDFFRFKSQVGEILGTNDIPSYLPGPSLAMYTGPKVIGVLYTGIGRSSE